MGVEEGVEGRLTGRKRYGVAVAFGAALKCMVLFDVRIRVILAF